VILLIMQFSPTSCHFIFLRSYASVTSNINIILHQIILLGTETGYGLDDRSSIRSRAKIFSSP
jgi:hypothetical protein